MSENKDLLVEVGTEELPPKALKRLGLAFADAVASGLAKQNLGYGDVRWFATPRRLAVIIRAVQSKQADDEILKRGPALTAAYDEDGKPTKAATGFARSCGVDVGELDTLKTEKGEWIAFLASKKGQHSSALLADIINDSLRGLPVPKRMRWGSSDVEFVRPVHWSVVLFGEESIACAILGTESCNQTYGHRFHHPAAITLTHADDYEQMLRDEGQVVAAFAERRQLIEELTHNAAKTANISAVIEADLLDEVTALVEWPVAVVASFEERFLALPEEVLIASMQDQQKYFPCRDSDGKLSAQFIFIANIASKTPEEIAKGNEKVIRPRLSDAAFFWEQDSKQALASHIERLEKVIFEQKLGSLFAKSQRLATLSIYLAESLSADSQLAERAARLAKCDLLTNMVGEFPKLQGVMGRYYAQSSGEPAAVALALDEQYQPRFAGDDLPASQYGQILALADRLDTIVGIFAIGKAPTGEKDPYALRRAAIGSLRIFIECGLALDLAQCVEKAVANYPDEIKADAITEDVINFMLERLRRYYLDSGTKTGVFDAVLAVRPTAPLDFHKRIMAVTAFSERPEAESLAAANKRIANILKQADTTTTHIDTHLLQAKAEQQLAKELQTAKELCAPLLEQANYAEVLTTLAGLRHAVDSFFDEVMVMSEDDRLKQNRVAVLKNLADMFMTIADIARLQNEKP